MNMTNQPVTINNKPVDKVTEATYLGSKLPPQMENNSIKNDINIRVTNFGKTSLCNAPLSLKIQA